MGKLTDAVIHKTNRDEDKTKVYSLREQLQREDAKRLNCDVPASLYKKLQLKVIQEDTSITSLINQFVYDYVYGDKDND